MKRPFRDLQALSRQVQADKLKRLLAAPEASSSGAVTWADVSGKPSTFTPSSHSHVAADVIDFAAAVAALITGKANSSHSHIASDIADAGAAGRLLLQAATSAVATALLDAFTSTEKGLAPASGGGTANFLRADGTWAPPPGGGSAVRAGHNLMKPSTGLFIANSANATALGTQAQVANRTVIAPFVPAYDITIDQIGISVSTLLAAANAKGVIYASDSNGRPTTILRETPNISAAAAATVFGTITSITLTAGTTYWIGVRASGTFTLRTLAVGALPALSYTNAATPVAQQVLIKTETFANAAADWTYASSQHSNALMPLVLMRTA